MSGYRHRIFDSIVVNNDDGNVGIGTVLPKTQFQVNGSTEVKQLHADTISSKSEQLQIDSISGKIILR